MRDVVIVGGGPAGVTAALHARELGGTVALIERGDLGGTCINDGCVPTRALAKAARLMRDVEQASAYGVKSTPPQIDLPTALGRTQEVVGEIHAMKSQRARLETAGVEVLTGTGNARFINAQTIQCANGLQLEAQHFILCAGGHARRLSFPGQELALTHNDIWSLTEVPRSLVVIGAASTGCQIASIFAAFGVKVHLLEVGSRILGTEDHSVSVAMSEAFAERGIVVKTSIGGVNRIERTGTGLKLVYQMRDREETIDTDAVLMAVGWPGNADALDVGRAGVQTRGGYVIVDEQLRTTAPHIFAAGDINGHMMLVQTARQEGRVAAHNALSIRKERVGYQTVPHGGFTEPEYGGVGLTESEARARENCMVAIVPYAQVERAIIDGRTTGFCKLIVARQSRRLLGAHLVGEQAVEIAQTLATGMETALTIEQLATLDLAYPTFTEIVGIAARQIVRELPLMSAFVTDVFETTPAY